MTTPSVHVKMQATTTVAVLVSGMRMSTDPGLVRRP